MTKRIGQRRYAPNGVLGLMPKAFGFFFDPPPERGFELVGDVAVVSITGPLMHHAGWFASYDEIKACVVEAIAAKPRAIVLKIDSPGGLASGNIDTAQEIRALVDGAGVALYAYVDGTAASAAYAIACVADHVAIPVQGVAGSVGCIDALLDLTAQDAMFGAKVTVIASGARKTDGNPHVQTSEAAIAARQKIVDDFAEVFFGHVAAHRGELDVETIRGYQAGIFVGADAVDNGLADSVMSFDQLLAAINAGTVGKEDTMPQDKSGAGPSASKAVDEAIETLRKAAETDDDEGKKAKRALAAWDDDGKKKDGDDAQTKKSESDDDGKEPDGDEKKSEDDGDDDEKKSEGDDDEKKSTARLSKLEQRVEDGERRQLLAQRPDFTKEQLATLAKAPLGVVESAVKTWPRNVIATSAAAVTPPITAPAGAGAPGSRLAPKDKAELDRRMGLRTAKLGVVHTEHKMTFGAPLPSEEGEG